MNVVIDFVNQYPFIFAFLFGLIPALIWLWFWLKEDTHPEPAKMITLSFIGGILAVIFVLPFEQLVFNYVRAENLLSFTLWAALEELFKFIFVYFIALRYKKIVDEPTDDVIYLIISALGFATAENALFLFGSLKNTGVMSAIESGDLRFVGASVLHILASATIGVCMALAFYKSKNTKRVYLAIGIILAILLHTLFNLFIINGVGGNIFLTFGAVWLGIAVLLLAFEKIKRIQN